MFIIKWVENWVKEVLVLFTKVMDQELIKVQCNSSFFFVGTNLLNNLQVAIKFEPRKSDAPQLRDEYRTYKILSGTRKYEKEQNKERT